MYTIINLCEETTSLKTKSAFFYYVVTILLSGILLSKYLDETSCEIHVYNIGYIKNTFVSQNVENGFD